MKLQEFKHGVDTVWNSIAEGWRRLRESASGGLTRFHPDVKSCDLPTAEDVDGDAYFPLNSWSMLVGNVYEDAGNVVVRLEIPGMKKSDFTIDVVGDRLVVTGEKRFEREQGNGRYRSFQCAYGSFRRVVVLPAPVDVARAKASYVDGILKVDLPKAGESRRKAIDLKID
ncbi:MAG TPA: Hsp20/alpha crystallin family protein [Rhodocyclaceae bacterium]|nr:Hsp20/alpha crystallin family protein [Rhodocyclaceae bacterium]